MNDNPSPTQHEETITFKRSHFYSILVVLAFAVGVLVGYMAWGRNSGIAAGTQAQANAAPTSAPGQIAEAPVTPEKQAYVRYDISTDGFPSLGPDDAPITIVEFSDYQCPFCKRFHDETYRPLLDAYPGKIRFVYRNLPLTSIHSEAFPSAVAAACAFEQDAFWPYHDKLFSSNEFGRQTYLQYATDLKLDMTAFQDCIDSDRHNDAINADADFAINLGINSTPTFFINGLALVGAQPIEVFRQVIDKELAGEIP